MTKASTVGGPEIVSQALAVLQRVFGYHSFRGRQADIIQHVLQGGDALVLMPTGGGKSLCYQLPALLRQGVGVVVSPLIALMEDQVMALRELGVAVACLHSQQDAAEQAQIEAALLAGTLDLLYVAPERLMSPRLLSRLSNIPLALFAIDEAHCVSQWGYDFRPEYRALAVLANRFPGVPRIALTATADPVTREDILDRLCMSDAAVFTTSFDRPNIRYTLVEKTDDVRSQLLDFIRREHPNDAGIIYCGSRHRVETIAAWLQAQDIPALPYHAGLEPAVRRAHQHRFIQDESVVMVATIAFGMGINKPDVRFVAHIDVPRSIEGYYQEVGRAGRDGAPASAWLAWGPQDWVQSRWHLSQHPDQKQAARLAVRLDAMAALCLSGDCRRQQLLSWFAEDIETCNNCDRCLKPAVSWDATEAARMALSCVYRTGQQFGVAHLVDVLRGKSSEKIRRYQHDTISTFGIGNAVSISQWRVIFSHLLIQGMVIPEPEQGRGLCLTEKARALLRGEQTLTVCFVTESLSTVVKPGRGSVARQARFGQLDADALALYEQLRQWRWQLAQQYEQPAFVVMSDTSLIEIAHQKPRCRDSLLGITGIGQAKLDKYGDDILRLVMASLD